MPGEMAGRLEGNARDRQPRCDWQWQFCIGIPYMYRCGCSALCALLRRLVTQHGGLASETSPKSQAIAHHPGGSLSRGRCSEAQRPGVTDCTHTDARTHAPVVGPGGRPERTRHITIHWSQRLHNNRPVLLLAKSRARLSRQVTLASIASCMPPVQRALLCTAGAGHPPRATVACGRALRCAACFSGGYACVRGLWICVREGLPHRAPARHQGRWLQRGLRML